MSGKLQEVLDKLQKANNTIAEQRKEIERQKALAIKRIVEGTSKELSDEEVFSVYKEAFGWEITNPKDNWVLLAREIERRIRCK
jgi:thioesterase domain-containing protein